MSFVKFTAFIGPKSNERQIRLRADHITALHEVADSTKTGPFTVVHMLGGGEKWNVKGSAAEVEEKIAKA
ncbi:hypothetical protein QTI66_32165 [Variovorax sp. J22R133]|uniref:hypothetical protein n=1 Tax=Variovorax brevis TaxID=3053503 RepID=UPI0025776E6D|nr:hypothetical protein [Variovorax sp. J22R133]MDM0116793.1 hypothetical protein [Variovorax sp. J22R133]